MPEFKNGYLTPPQSPPPQHAQQRQPWVLPHPSLRIGKILGRSLELVDIIGTGAYGVVYEGYDHHTGAAYAVKALSKVNADGEPLDKRQRDFHAREIQLHYAASAHPNVLTMLKIVDDPDCTYVVLQYCTEGDLFSSITEKGRYVGNDELVRKAFLQILEAVEHCHRLGIYHRDLKPENILVSNFGTEMLLADFGLATTDLESEDHGCGSTFYMSPECLDQSPKGSKYQCAANDIWSLGVILVNLACGRNPWKQASVEDSTYRAFTRNRNFLKTILPLSEELNDILGRIFDPCPKARITVGELKECIARCPTFTGPIQQVALPSPPPSPRSYTTARSASASSDEGSLASDEGSLTGSCSTLSDSDFSDDETTDSSDEGYKSMEQEPQIKQDPHVFAQRIVEPEPFSNQAPQYALPPLPQQRCQNWPSKPNPWMQPWGQYPAVSHQFQPAIRGCVSPSYSSCHYGSGYR